MVDKVGWFIRLNEKLGKYNVYKTKYVTDFAATALVAPVFIINSPKYNTKEEKDLKKYYAWRKPLEAIGAVMMALLFQGLFNTPFGIRSILGELPKYLNTRVVFDTKKLAGVEDLMTHLGDREISREVQEKLKGMYKLSQKVFATRQAFSAKFNFLQKTLGDKAHPFRDENEIEEAVKNITKSGELTQILSKTATRALTRVAQEAKILLQSAVKMEDTFTKDLRNLVKTGQLDYNAIDKMKKFLIINRPDQLTDYREIIRHAVLIIAIPLNTFIINLLFPTLVKHLHPRLDKDARREGKV